jgi:N6-adenosine-specific RNA methylase IME4
LTATFPIVHPDPNWEYNQRCIHSDTKFGGGANSHYETDGLTEMASWKDQFLAMRPASGVMLMWVTGPHVETAPKLMRAWGYTPIKPVLYWVKTYPGGPNIFCGPGSYTESNVEFILLGQASMKPGKIMTPENCGGRRVKEVHYAPHPRDDDNKIIHSKKPAIFRELIVEMFGDQPRVEVFARERVPGWHAIGDQIPGGQLIQPGRVITPLSPVTAAEAFTRRRGAVVQRSFFIDQEGV